MSRLLAVAAHESSHTITAWVLGWQPRIQLEVIGCLTGTKESKTIVAGLDLASHPAHAFAIQHIGWIFSLVLAVGVAASGYASMATCIALVWTALDALSSDLAGCRASSSSNPQTFEVLCGNFGVILLRKMRPRDLKLLLKNLVQVTMQRGAQTAGLVTYKPRSNQEYKGVRVRVVNGKRTDLAKLLLDRASWAGMFSQLETPAIFQGHTRFATSSIANFDGCHPHQWSPPLPRKLWYFDEARGGLRTKHVNCEAFISHNGDLDAFKMSGLTHSLSELQNLLPACLDMPLTTSVDSMCIAGLLELFRTKGQWLPSLRYAIIVDFLATMPGGLMPLRKRLPTATELVAVVQLIEAACIDVVRRPSVSTARNEADALEACVNELRETLREIVSKQIRCHTLRLSESELHLPSQSLGSTSDVAKQIADATLAAFASNDLLKAAQQLLGGAIGSFGLVLTHSLDASNQIVIAARGQPMSFAVYPRLGAIVFGSEAQATKVAIEADAALTPEASTGDHDQAIRVDLDDLAGETVLLSWGHALKGQYAAGSELLRPSGRDSSQRGRKLGVQLMRYPAVQQRSRTWSFGRAAQAPSDAFLGAEALSFVDGTFLISSQMRHRSVRLAVSNRSLTAALNEYDPVGVDLEDIPTELKRIESEFRLWQQIATKQRASKNVQFASTDEDEHEPSLGNVMVANEFASLLRMRLRRRARGQDDGSLDVLITGCEVSLWVGEQFASDLRLVFPHLKISSISANKLLGHMGQEFAIPTVGFSFNTNLRNTIVILISHTGGTFATVSTAHLLREVTPHLFAITENWDTTLARAILKPGNAEARFEKRNLLQSTFARARVFTTGVGARPAEPCSVSLAAIHQLLTQLLLHLMLNFDPGSVGGQRYSKKEVEELAKLNSDSLATLSTIVDSNSEVNAHLVEQGRRWGWHVLDGPMSWILSALYIAVTVVSGWTPITIMAVLFTSQRGEEHDFDAPTVPHALAESLATSCMTAHAENVTEAFACAVQLGAQVSSDDWHWRPTHAYIIGAIDALIYIFLPIWTTWFLRLLQGRPVLHRVAGRSVVIGDVPWVAQSLEAFVSKLFALCA